jgi:putative peptidoglycan lipid II flippase
MPHPRSGDGRHIKTAMIITAIIALSKIAGFVREIIMASVFGLSVEADAYIAAYGILSIMTLLFSAGISSTFIPIYVRAQLRDGKKAANRYASNVLSIYMICGIAGTVAAYFFAPVICRIVYHAPQGLELTIELTRLMYPTLAFYAMTGVLYNVLNARERFIPEQLMGFVLSGVLITACLVYREIHAVAIAVSVVGVAQFLLMLPFLRGHFRYYPTLTLSDRRIGRTFMLAIPALVSMAFGEINHQVDCAIGSSLGTGVISSINKSYSLIATVLGVLVVPITTIMFSRLSKIAANRDRKLFLREVRSGLETVMLVTLPIIVICVFLRNEIISVVFQRGAFSKADAAFTAPVFAFYIIGVLGFGIRNFLTRVCYALQDTKSPMYIGIFSVALNCLLDLLLAPLWGPSGIVLATSVAGFTGAMIMLWQLHHTLGNLGLVSTLGQGLRMIAAIAAAFAAMVGVSLLIGQQSGTLGRLVYLTGCGISFLAVYFSLCMLMRVREVGTLTRLFNRGSARRIDRP